MARRLEAAIFIAGCVRKAHVPGNGIGGRTDAPICLFGRIGDADRPNARAYARMRIAAQQKNIKKHIYNIGSKAG